MKWFKHDSDAHADAKLEKVRIKYGLQGYGLYWYCLELIARSVDKNNLSFELEHDAEIIAFRTGVHRDVIQEMMSFMVDIGLFHSSEGRIFCLKMAYRLDENTQKEQRKLRSRSGVTPELLGTNSALKEEKRTEKKRKETPPAIPLPRKKRLTPLPDDFGISPRVQEWAESKGYRDLPLRLEHFVSYAKRSGKTYADWDEAFMASVRDDWAKLSSRDQPSDSGHWATKGLVI